MKTILIFSYENIIELTERSIANKGLTNGDTVKIFSTKVELNPLNWAFFM